LQYEITRVVDGKSVTDNAKVVAIETLDKTQDSQARVSAGAGVKM
jgi:hypothetical protein